MKNKIKPYVRSFVFKLKEDINKYPEFIHVVLGPRQVGKTTGVHQLLGGEYTKEEGEYVSADGDIQKPSSWVLEQIVRSKSSKKKILVIDEIQKVENWSENVKKFWDEQKIIKPAEKMILILLGSSSLEIQKGLTESLAGRFLLHRVNHWNFEESKVVFDLSFEDFLKYGGYPAGYQFRSDQVTWQNYIKNSIVAAVLGRDILSLARVKSPALFRQCFDIASSYSAQEISYTKLLGQLQDKGNTDQIKYYLELFEGAFLLKQLFKYSNKRALTTKTSSPKIITLCPALYFVSKDFHLEKDEYGRAFESYIGAVLNSYPGTLYYWREKNFEVDFVIKFGAKVLAIEVKSSKKKNSGLGRFKDQFPTAELFIITFENHAQVLKDVRDRLL